MRKAKLLSIVVPCHNEEEVLRETNSSLKQNLEELLKTAKIADYEILYVDNGSTDKTLSVLQEIFSKDTKVKIYSLRKNFGYQGSISAGLFYSTGDIVITIDADLQDPPEKIKDMVDFYEKGFDLVLGIREKRGTDSFFKRLFAQNYYRLLKIIKVPVVYNHGDFRLMSRSLVDEFNTLAERNRFIRAMILQLESRYAQVFYERRSREKGRSKFSVSSLFSLGMDGIISFSYIPLRLASLIGVLFFFFGLAGALWVLYIKIFSNSFPGWASIMLPMLIIGGLQLFFMGLIGEYIGRLYVEIKHRPLFLVREKYIH
ncbi:MAG: glycosyltransferase family 2 protein [bacterium]|nr:glycosyltransferase family 2 protein [bacterium]